MDAVVYFRIFDPIMAVCNVHDAQKATRLLAATTLRNVLGTRAMSEVLSERESISHEMQVHHRDNQHCNAIRLWFFHMIGYACFDCVLFSVLFENFHSSGEVTIATKELHILPMLSTFMPPLYGRNFADMA